MQLGKTPNENERIFRDWLKLQLMENGMRCYLDNEIAVYAHALRVGSSEIESSAPNNLFQIWDPVMLQEAYDQLQTSLTFDSVNESNNGTLTTAMELYKQLVTGGTSAVPTLHAAFYLGKGGLDVGNGESRGASFYFHEVPMKAVQKVFYGAPGTGKSFSVNKLLAQAYPDEATRTEHCLRVIFHPAYTYGDFVGSVKNMTSQDSPLDYVFVAGPFTTLLKAAFLHPEEKYFLIIEEINRGDAPAIFGDVFQLLDRAPEGKSMYTIVNRDVAGYFCMDPWMRNIFKDGRIWIPANVNILATMNTADDNIFVMDSAFKRRFQLEYVPISYDILPDSMKRERGIFYGSRPLREVFSDQSTALGKYAAVLDAKGELKRNWPTFAKLVNHAIDAENLKAKRAGKPHDKLIAENKKFGPFFIHEEELDSKDAFINKVIFYLKQDVFYDSPTYLTYSFEEIYDLCMGDDADLFAVLVENI